MTFCCEQYLQETCLSYVMKNFSSLVKDKEFLSKISSSTLKDILEIYMGGKNDYYLKHSHYL